MIPATPDILDIEAAAAADDAAAPAMTASTMLTEQAAAPSSPAIPAASANRRRGEFIKAFRSDRQAPQPQWQPPRPSREAPASSTSTPTSNRRRFAPSRRRPIWGSGSMRRRNQAASDSWASPIRSAGAALPTLRMALKKSSGRPHSELTKIPLTLTAIAIMAQTG